MNQPQEIWKAELEVWEGGRGHHQQPQHESGWEDPQLEGLQDSQ